MTSPSLPRRALGALPLTPLAPRAAVRPLRAASPAAPSPTQSAPTGTAQPPNVAAWLAQRVTFGYTPAVAAEIEAQGHDVWLSRQLHPHLLDDAAADAALAAFDWLDATAHELVHHPTLVPSAIAAQLPAVRLVRAVRSRLQVLERVVELWTDHFNVFGGRVLIVPHDRDVIRVHALGRFRDLLHAVTKSAAMIAFLDNDSSVAGAPNENLAREVLELHTLGVDGPYSEADVREFARCLTGWTYVQDQGRPDFGAFHFDVAVHDFGAKQVLGLTLPASAPTGQGVVEGERVLDLLADHPATVLRVTGKLARWFFGPEAPARVIHAGEVAWRATGGDLRAVLRAVLSEASFHEAAPWSRPRFRRPFDFATALYRATGAALDEPVTLLAALAPLGQTPFQWPAPDGFPDGAEAFAHLIEPRWAFAADFAHAVGTGMTHTPTALAQLVAGVPVGAWAAHLDRRFTGGVLRADELGRLQRHLDALAPQTAPLALVAEAIEGLTSLPSYQFH